VKRVIWSRRAALGICLLAASFGTAVPARADWLVTREGAKVETKGPWKVNGKRVIFTEPDGTLASLRLADVDLDASQRVTAEAAQAKPADAAPAAEKKKSVRVLTDKDFAHPEAAAAETAAAEAPAAAGGETTPEKPEAANRLQVANWKQVYSQESRTMEISGSVRNTSQDLLGAIGVTVHLLDDKGQQIAEQSASLNTRSLKPGQDTGFKAVFPGIGFFDTAKFEVQALPLALRPSPETPPAAQPAEETPPQPPPF